MNCTILDMLSRDNYDTFTYVSDQIAKPTIEGKNSELMASQKGPVRRATHAT